MDEFGKTYITKWLIFSIDLLLVPTFVLSELRGGSNFLCKTLHLQALDEIRTPVEQLAFSCSCQNYFI